jgi:hypothetical protein
MTAELYALDYKDTQSIRTISSPPDITQLLSESGFSKC